MLVVGALHINRSTNGGQSLTRITSGYIMTVDPHLDVHAIVADPNYNGTSNARVYVATDGGIHRADNIKTVRRGSGWVDLDATMRSSQFYGADGHRSGDFVVGGTQDNGTLRLRGSNPAANLVFGGDGGQIQIDPTNPNYIYGEYQYLGAPPFDERRKLRPNDHLGPRGLRVRTLELHLATPAGSEQPPKTLRRRAQPLAHHRCARERRGLAGREEQRR